MGHQAANGPPPDSPAVVIVGASARALAQSAVAAGWQVDTADLFADLDLRAVAREAVCVADAGEPYPWSLATAARHFAAGPWCYTGALENHPAVIDALAAERPLAGNPGDRVRAVRDPDRLAEAVRAIGGAFPETVRTAAAAPTDGSYLVKPLASAGGRGIAAWRGGPVDAPATRVWQRRIAGAGVSAAFVCGVDGARLLGIAHQATGLPWCHAAPFAFCAAVCDSLAAAFGGAGAAVAEQCAAIGEMLAKRFGLRGAVGVDAVVDARGRVWVIEVNPRPTASMELYERATGQSLATLHLAGCGVAPAARRVAQPPPREARWAKAVLHAPHDIAVSAAVGERWRDIAAAWTEDDGGWPAVADIPAPAQTIRRAAPWITVFAAADTAAQALTTLERRAAAIAATLAPLSPPCGAASAPSTRADTA